MQQRYSKLGPNKVVDTLEILLYFIEELKQKTGGIK